jgi:hypothetical protein
LALFFGFSAPEALAQPLYVFSSWQAGAVGNCRITDKHKTTDCDAVPGPNGVALSDKFVDTYLNNQDIPDAPIGKRVTVMIKLKESARGAPPDAAQTDVTESHQRELQRQYYPRAALAEKLEGKASADCTVREDGQLDDCWITDEEPAGAGFGGATLNLINLMKLASPLPASRRQSFTISWSLPGPSDQAFVNCLITPELLTSACTTDPDVDYPGAAQDVLSALADKPLHMPNAPAGQRIEIALMRAELKIPQSVGTPEPVSAPYKAVRVTPLTAGNVLYYYPPISIRLEQGGNTDAQCKVADDGSLNECWIVSNQSGAERLGHAHLRLTGIVKMQPPTASSPPYDQRLYTFRIAWSVH